jgi:hypothetical protein
MSRTVLGLVAAGAVILAIALGAGWYANEHDRAVIDHAVKPGPVAPPPAAVPDAAKQAEPARPGVSVPTFDVARIGRDGHAVIAGRAAPGAKIVLLDGGKEIARGEADANGEWVVVAQDPPLAPGQHELRVVQHIEGRAPVTSEQAVVAVVPERANTTDDTLVMIAPPGGASTLLQSPSAAGVPKSNDLQMSTLDYDERGHVTITGKSANGAAVRAYIDDKIVAEGAAGSDGHWRLVPGDPVAPGKHTLRLDRLGGDGKPVARLEMPFERAATAPVAPESNRRLSVIKGDNLWNIARAHYGEGWQFTVIFNANKGQIRDPNLIYPGQVFSLPKVN